MDADTWVDLVVSLQTALGVAIFFNGYNGQQGTFDPIPRIIFTDDPGIQGDSLALGLVVTDLDNDTINDIALTCPKLQFFGGYLKLLWGPNVPDRWRSGAVTPVSINLDTPGYDVKSAVDIVAALLNEPDATGLLDLAIANDDAVPPCVSVLINQGARTFGLTNYTAVNAKGITANRFRAGKRPDLVITDNLNSRVRILWN
ncbi:MAG: hypothetical protein ACREUU_06135, partial [Gammaproteobacteria bacterium]